MNPLVYRRFVLPVWYFLKGAKIKRYYGVLVRSNAIGVPEDKKLARLKELLLFCQENVPFYRNLFQSLNISIDDIVTMEDYPRLIPVLTKDQVRENYQELIPECKIPRKYGITQTSGSTGKSTKFRVDYEAGERWLAAKLFHRSLHGVFPGDRTLWIWGRSRQKVTRLRKFVEESLKNEYRISAFDITEESALYICSLIRKKRIQVIYGYSSAVYEYAKLIDSLGINITLKKIFVTAEKLYDDQKKKIEEVFGCQVVNEYGAAEMGILGIECSYNNLHVVEENVYCEVVSDTSGQNQIIVTDFHNYAMPLLRYDSGDLSDGISHLNCSCGSKMSVFQNIVGRKYDMIRLRNGKTLHGEVVNYLIKEVCLVNQSKAGAHQFVQHDYENFTLTIESIGMSANELEVCRKNLEKGFKDYLGDDCNYELGIHFVNRIERPKTGKHRYLISELNL